MDITAAVVMAIIHTLTYAVTVKNYIAEDYFSSSTHRQFLSCTGNINAEISQLQYL